MIGKLAAVLFSKNFRRFAAVNALHRTILRYRAYSTSTFKTQPYALHRLECGPSADLSVTKEDALKLYREMTLIRKMEQTAATMYTEKFIRGFLHLYAGQEAICVGMHKALKPQDDVITAYRCHGWCYMMGIEVAGILAELTGRSTGNAKGKGGSMHMYAKNFYGGNGIVGAHVPVGTGLGYAHKYKGDKGICMCLYGDGASNQGQVAESFNMAKLWSIPMVYVCENNLYGMGTSCTRSSANTNYYTRGDLIPGIRVDGMDVLAMREVAKFGREHAVNKGPIVIEAVTYRYFGHSMSDPGVSYRSREEIQEVRKTRDPITTFKEKILKAKIVNESDLKPIDESVKKEVEAAAKRAKTDKEVDIAELAYDLYSNNLAGKVRNNVHFKPLEHKLTRTPINLK